MQSTAEDANSQLDGDTLTRSIGLVYDSSTHDPAVEQQHTSREASNREERNNLVEVATAEIQKYVTGQLQAEKQGKVEWPFEPIETARVVPTLSHAPSRKVQHRQAESAAKEEPLDAIFFDTECLRSAYTFPRTRDAMRPETVEALRGASRASTLRMLASDDTQQHSSKRMASSIKNERTETGVVPTLFPTQLRSGRGLGVPAERAQWPRPIKTYTGTIPANSETHAREELRRMEILKHRHVSPDSGVMVAQLWVRGTALNCRKTTYKMPRDCKS
jgi:hypothetical protein